MNYSKAIGLSFLCLCFSAVHAQKAGQTTDNPLKTVLDSAADKAATAYFADGKAIGLTIGVIRDGRIKTYHYGENIKGSGKLPSDESYVNIGSVAKTFVGTLLAQAVNDKKIGLQDDIRKYLPGSYPNLQYRRQPIRVVDLANHTSGLPTSIHQLTAKELDSLKKLDFPGQARLLSFYNADSLLADLHQVRPDTLPGTRFRYNSNAVMVLQLILERVYQQNFTTLATDWLQLHLQMRNTSPVLSAAQLKAAAQGYNKDGNPQPYVNIGGFYVGPTMNSTVSDLLVYLKAQLAETDPAIRLSHQMTWGNPRGFAIGLNWMIDSMNGVRYWYHDGNTKLGFNTLCTFYPAQHLALIVIANDVQSQEKVGRVENAMHATVAR